MLIIKELHTPNPAEDRFEVKVNTKDFEEYTLEGMSDPEYSGEGKGATLTFIDTVGYGDTLDLTKWEKPIIDYLTSKVSWHLSESL